MNIEAFREYCLSLAGATEGMPFDEETLVFYVKDKMFALTNIDSFQSINLKCERFEFCPEVTAKVRKKGYKIYELPIHYDPRTAEEGKKINWKDGIEAFWTLFKYRFIN